MFLTLESIGVTDEMIQGLIASLTQKGQEILFGLIILFVGFKLVNYLEKRFSKSKSIIKIDPTLQSFSRSAIRMGLKAMIVISAITAMGVEMSTFVAIIGAAGIAVGLALQGSLSNLAGGVLIITLRPFKVGDFVEVSGHSGVVTNIGLFYSYLTTFDNKAVIIPNSDLANGSMINYTTFPTRRVDITFGVGYGSDIEKVKSTIRKVIDSNEMIFQDPAPFVRLNNHGASSLDFRVRVWTNTTDYWEVYHTLLEEVKKAFDKEGIEIPFPQVVVHKGLEEADN